MQRIISILGILLLLFTLALFFSSPLTAQNEQDSKESDFKRTEEMFTKAQEEKIPLLSPTNLTQAYQFYQAALADQQNRRNYNRMQENFCQEMY